MRPVPKSIKLLGSGTAGGITAGGITSIDTLGSVKSVSPSIGFAVNEMVYTWALRLLNARSVARKEKPRFSAFCIPLLAPLYGQGELVVPWQTTPPLFA